MPGCLIVTQREYKERYGKTVCNIHWKICKYPGI